MRGHERRGPQSADRRNVDPDTAASAAAASQSDDDAAYAAAIRGGLEDPEVSHKMGATNRQSRQRWRDEAERLEQRAEGSHRCDQPSFRADLDQECPQCELEMAMHDDDNSDGSPPDPAAAAFLDRIDEAIHSRDPDRIETYELITADSRRDTPLIDSERCVMLAGTESWGDVRIGAIRHPNMPVSLLRQLADDPDEMRVVRDTAREALTARTGQTLDGHSEPF